MIKVSVIMPVYNAEKYVEKALKSIYNQTLKDIEVICVNDGSTDNSLNILNNLANTYDFIKIFTQENQGSGKARNKGIEEATGEYIAFLDADDIFIDKDALEKMYFYGNKNNAEMVGANLKRINLDGSIDDNYDFLNTDFKYFEETGTILPVEYGIPFAFYKNIYKREFINKIGAKFPDLLRGQDPVFLSEILVNLDIIYSLNCDLYGYNNKVAGGVNLKVNNYEKKYDYIKHFKDTLDILKQNQFDNSFEGYKNEFMKYLIFEGNPYDNDIKKIVCELFEYPEDYFSEEEAGYKYIKTLQNDKDLEDLNTELHDFKEIKRTLFEETLINDNFIDVDYLRKYNNLLIENREKEEDMDRLSFDALQTVGTQVFSDSEFLRNNIEKIKEETKQVNDKNNAILSSNSWKYTEFLRIMKHFYKK